MKLCEASWCEPNEKNTEEAVNGYFQVRDVNIIVNHHFLAKDNIPLRLETSVFRTNETVVAILRVNQLVNNAFFRSYRLLSHDEVVCLFYGFTLLIKKWHHLCQFGKDDVKCVLFKNLLKYHSVLDSVNTSLEFSHLDGSHSTFFSFVSKASASACLCLFEIICCENSKDDRYCACSVELCKALSDA